MPAPISVANSIGGIAATHYVSVLAPVGAALLGLAVGQSIDWPCAGGKTRELRILKVVGASKSVARSFRLNQVDYLLTKDGERRFTIVRDERPANEPGNQSEE